MSDELEPTPSYSPEVEIRRIEAYEVIQKSTLEQQKTMQEGWQKIVTDVTEAVKSYAIRRKELEERSSWIILTAVVILVLVVAALTWIKIVPAEGLTFLVGIVIGYLISLSPLSHTIGG